MAKKESTTSASATKTYKYQIDVAEVISLLTLTRKWLVLDEKDKEIHNFSNTEWAFAQRNDISQDKRKQLQKELDFFTGGSKEVEALLRLCETRLAEDHCTIVDMLMLNGGPVSELKRCYYLENQKVVTEVFKTQFKLDIKLKIDIMLAELSEYSRKFKSKTLRLCFSSEQELYSICTKIFSQENVLMSSLGRKVIYFQFNFIQIL